ncbi:hypothetical protein CCH79_00020680 [Gambusia affinis]|uniref:Uncharacterized protein n=1 Tax=Gambusia affinis TaxID=33528 RepID=A0A315WCB7_GAMAF|nr:hypothetical protein CCH79_00020680 [Gambusia affinis]
MPLFHARGVFQYSFGLIPYRKPIHTVAEQRTGSDPVRFWWWKPSTVQFSAVKASDEIQSANQAAGKQSADHNGSGVSGTRTRWQSYEGEVLMFFQAIEVLVLLKQIHQVLQVNTVETIDVL